MIVLPNEKLLIQIADWHRVQDHGKIREAILAIPEQERSDELLCLYAQALNNDDDYNGALAVLDSIYDRYSSDPFFCVRYAIALYSLHREYEALGWFKKAKEKGLDEINEMPGTYLPKSVTKWIERAVLWAPRRIEQNAFEAVRRAQRNKNPQDAGLDDFGFQGFWDDSAYSLKEYVGRTPTDTDIAEAEAALGYRLPASYKALIKKHNGGLLAKNCFKNPLQRD